jgi:hypothetical protein
MDDPSEDQPPADAEPSAADVRTVSVVRLERDEWIAVNVDDPTIRHHALSLTDLIAAHRHAVAFRIGKALTLRYLIGGEETADRIDLIRSAGARIAGLRREANHAEAVIRSERIALMRDLAELQVAPGEIAQIIGVPTTAVPKELGTDRDARLARTLHTHARAAEQPSKPERLF